MLAWVCPALGNVCPIHPLQLSCHVVTLHHDLQHKLTSIEHKAEAPERKDRELDLVLYNVQEMLQDDADRHAVCTLLQGTYDMLVAMGRFGPQSRAKLLPQKSGQNRHGT